MKDLLASLIILMFWFFAMIPLQLGNMLTWAGNSLATITLDTIMFGMKIARYIFGASLSNTMKNTIEGYLNETDRLKKSLR